ncbi:PKD domain-containing protein [Methylomonas koyamae]|uniref:PKD domain-containing protein n=1 Tax=Methylomonas koyamae TaxID=702114 RepID=UPI0028738E3C|nr:PKD domain-containing protein [Methylomonas koyamae]WNB77436.1 PKD domain-containing protein [Methylomonas koyamae]
MQKYGKISSLLAIKLNFQSHKLQHPGDHSVKARCKFQAVAFLFLMVCSVLVHADSFSVDERILVSTTRINRNQSDFVYSVKIANQDVAASSVSAAIGSNDPNTLIIDGSLSFGAIASGAQGLSNDTFTIRHDRRFPFNPDALTFKFTAIPAGGNIRPIANAGVDQTVLLNSLVTLDGTGSSDADGNPLAYQWSLVSAPSGSNVVLAQGTQTNPRFTPDKPGQYVIELIVNDGYINSTPDHVVISTENSAPIADAGLSQTSLVGSTVTLDGSHSADVDGDPLSFNWIITSKPDNSIVVLNDKSAVKPQFVIDQPGTYQFQLIVSDGKLNSQPDTVIVSTQNSAPVANAGQDQTTFVNKTVLLDGTQSSDVDGHPLTYKWSVASRPNGSSSNLSNVSAPQTSLLIDYPGNYVIQLIVNDGFTDSLADTVVISTQNSKPLANAGIDKTVFVTNRLELDGSASSDADHDALKFSWSISSKPTASKAVLLNPTNVKPSITIDYPGTYVIQLIVNDGTNDSLADTMVIATQNSKPVANAGSDESVFVGAQKALNGSLSFDVDYDALAYQWSVSAKPDGSNPVLLNGNKANPEITTDKPGIYVLQLIVSDGKLSSDPDSVLIEAKVPEVEIQASVTTGSAPLDVTLNAIPNGGFAPYQFEWDLDGNGSADDVRKNFVYTFLQRGVIEVTLKMKDAKGYQALAKQVISVTSAPSVLASASPNSGSAPLLVNFAATVNDIDGVVQRFDWDFDGDGIVDHSSNSSAGAAFTYQRAGLYHAKLTVYDNDGLSSADTVDISVGSAPEVTATVDKFTGISPFTATFSGSVTDKDGKVVLYEWDFDGDKAFDYSSSQSASVSHTYTQGGIYNATLRVSDNDGLIDEDSLIIAVSGPPTSLPGAYPLSGAAPLTVTFFSDGKDLDGGPEYYDWDFDGNGTYDQRLIASQNTTFTYSQPGVYRATLKVVDDDGLSSTDFVTITVTENTAGTIGVPTVSANAAPTVGSTPLKTILSGFAQDDGSIVKYEWDFESDGTYEFAENATGIGLITETIDVGSYAHQTFADLDADGDLDMLIGNSNGQINYFRNEGTSKVFQFANQGLVTDGANAAIDIGSYAAPYAYDIDGDQDFDLLVGDSNGYVYVLENTGNKQTANWTNKGILKLANGANLDVGSYATPKVYAVGSDNDWDLIIGNSNGNLAIYENTGSINTPAWVDNGDIQDNTGALVDIGSYAVPLLVDHDGDGDKDLYIGESGGKVVLLINQGSGQSPVWANQGFLSDSSANAIDVGSYATPTIALTSGAEKSDFWIGNSDGQIVWYQQNANSPLAWQSKSNPFNNVDVGSYASPARVDYDANGIWDLVVGNSDGYLQLINNLGTEHSPIFRPGEILKDLLGVAIDSGTYASPAFSDLDQDGDDDLVVGNGNGQLLNFVNTGSPTIPQWAPQGFIGNSSGTAYDIGSYSSPFFFDWDNDGDEDIVAGNSNGNLYLIRNAGSPSVAKWDSPSLISDNAGVIDVGSYAKPLVADFNADGRLDLLVGNSDGVIYRYENISQSSSIIWALKDAQLAKADVGSYAAPVAFNLDGDIDEDLLIGNSSGLIYQLKSYGVTEHTYHTEGKHQATLRVTDNSGNKAVDRVEINVLPTGYPSVGLGANVKEGVVPLKVDFVATAKDSDGSVVSYEWDFDGDGTYEKTGSALESYTYQKIGIFSPTVRVIDNEGKKAQVSVPLTVTMQVNFSHNPVINPGVGEKSAISTVLAADATVTLKVVDELGNVIRVLVNGQFRTAGSYIDSWDGYDGLNNPVGDGAYYFVFSYSQNGVEKVIDARASATFNQYTPNRTWPSTFNPYTGVPVTSTYTVNKPSEVSFYFWVRDNSRPGSTIAPVRTLFIRELKAAGTHTETWDGVNDSGVPVKPGEQYPITLWVYELPDNAIVITGSKPVISNLAVTNRTFSPAFNPYSTTTIQNVRVQFNISKDSTMDIVAIDSNGLQIDRSTKSGLTAGVNSISWDGRNFNDELVPPGVYSLQLTAIDAKGNRSLPRYAIVTVRY